MRRTLLGFLALITFSEAPYAQVDLTAYISVPVGPFADIDDGMAQTRGGLSASYYKPLSSLLAIGGEVAFIMNTMDRAAFASMLIEDGASNVSVGGGTYFNYPVLASILISPEQLSAHGISLYGSAGVDFMSMMDMDLEINGNSATIKFDAGSAFAWAIGMQATVGQYFFGLRYLNLGEHTIQGKMIFDSGYENIIGTQKVSVVNFLIGVHL